MSTPAVVIAAPASGSGKTTVATGLMGALRRAGHRVAPFKVGPDFIDPGYHALAASRAGRNLDPVLVGEQLIGPLYRHGSADADIAVVEGVMGLFDGRITDDTAGTAQGSTAHVASLLGAPVVLVVDARGQSHSIAALLHGFSTFDQSVRLAGVILNRVGSPCSTAVTRPRCRDGTDSSSARGIAPSTGTPACSHACRNTSSCRGEPTRLRITPARRTDWSNVEKPCSRAAML